MSELNPLQKLCTGEPEFVAGHIYGLRQWYVENLNGNFYSDNGIYGHNSFRWNTHGPNTAKCAYSDKGYHYPYTGWLSPKFREPHEVTDPRCSCGFYAYTNRTELVKNSNSDPYQHVTGIIKAWGRVTIGTKGFRAQYAQIVALTVRTPAPPPRWEQPISFSSFDPWPPEIEEKDDGCDWNLIPRSMPRYTSIDGLMNRYHELVREAG